MEMNDIDALYFGVNPKPSKTLDQALSFQMDDIQRLINETNSSYKAYRKTVFLCHTMEWYKLFEYEDPYDFTRAVLNAGETDIGKQYNRASIEYIISQGDTDFIGSVRDYHLDLLHRYVPRNIEKDIRKRSDTYVAHMTDSWRYLLSELGEYSTDWTGIQITDLLEKRLNKAAPKIVKSVDESEHVSSVSDNVDTDWDDEHTPSQKYPEDSKTKEAVSTVDSRQKTERSESTTINSSNELPQFFLTESSATLNNSEFEKVINLLSDWLAPDDREDFVSQLCVEVLRNDETNIHSLLYLHRKEVGKKEYQTSLRASLKKLRKSTKLKAVA